MGLPLRSSVGLIDLHFHGAFGIDLMHASPQKLDELSDRLWREGIAGFCATTLSSPPAVLLEAVRNLGRWIRSGTAPGARPLGIHLEGPFISPEACGAHPPGTVRKLRFSELERLWKASEGTLRILTVAPESLNPSALGRLVSWARARKIHLSLGHSRATEAEAKAAFGAGFTGVTHAWNALPFHHRAPGPLGAALGNRAVFVELIIDRVHVSPTLIRWTRSLHPPERTCFISDCVPAGATRAGSWHSFGSLRIRFRGEACYLPDGALAGGGLLLSDSFSRWAREESRQTGRPLSECINDALPSLTSAPLAALGIPVARLKDRRVRWRTGPGGNVRFIPIDSASRSS